jgi:hypothetical protein
MRNHQLRSAPLTVLVLAACWAVLNHCNSVDMGHKRARAARGSFTTLSPALLEQGAYAWIMSLWASPVCVSVS